MSGILSKFHNASWGGPQGNGFAYISDFIMPESDILILSEMDHSFGHSKYNDFFSTDKLDEYASKGVTDIYVEVPEWIDPYRQDLIEGRMERDEFIEKLCKDALSFGLTSQEHREQVTDLADAVLHAAKTNPPINFHFVQISESAEQKEVLSLLDQQLKANGGEAISLSNKFFAELSAEGTLCLKEEISAVYALEDEFSISRVQYDKAKYLGEPDWFASDLHDYLSKHLGNDIPDEKIEKFAQELDELRTLQKATMDESFRLFRKFRFDNDSVLAENVAQTKRPDGKAIILHGMLHGAKNHNDLDDKLEAKGLLVNRVNVYYQEQDFSLFEENSRPADMSDINWLVNDDIITVTDWDNDDIVDGTVCDNNALVVPVALNNQFCSSVPSSVN